MNELLEILRALPPGLRPPLLEADRAHLAGEDPKADRHFTAAAAQLRGLELPLHLADVELEHAECLTARGCLDDARALVAEARETFERLQAAPWLQRLAAMQTGKPAEIPA